MCPIRRILLLAWLVLASAGLRSHAGEAVPMWRATIGRIEFVADHELPHDQLAALAAHVADVQQRLEQEIGLPPLTTVLRVYLFDDRRTFALFVQEMIPSVRATDTLSRHGIFLQRDGQPHVFLLKSDELAQSLRHETVHVVVNAAVPDAPLWLDEGLAQCYEAADGTHGNPRAERVLRRDWLRRQPPSLEELAGNTSIHDMSPRDYAGAWHHLHAMLATEQGRASVRELLQQLQRP